MATFENRLSRRKGKYFFIGFLLSSLTSTYCDKIKVYPIVYGCAIYNNDECKCIWRINNIAGKHGGNTYRLDTKNKTPEQNIIEIIQGLYLKKPFHNDTSPTNKSFPSEFRLGRLTQKSSSDSYRWSYLDALVTLLNKEDRSKLGFTSDELMTW